MDKIYRLVTWGFFAYAAGFALKSYHTYGVTWHLGSDGFPESFLPLDGMDAIFQNKTLFKFVAAFALVSCLMFVQAVWSLHRTIQSLQRQTLIDVFKRNIARIDELPEEVRPELYRRNYAELRRRLK